MGGKKSKCQFVKDGKSCYGRPSILTVVNNFIIMQKKVVVSKMDFLISPGVKEFINAN